MAEPLHFDNLKTINCDRCGERLDVSDREPLSDMTCPKCDLLLRVPGAIGTLLVLEEIGRGGVSVVYRGYDRTLARYVAVKVLDAPVGETQPRVEANVAEARAIATISHPSVVHIHTIGMRDARPYIVMELLLGHGRLDELLAGGWTSAEWRALQTGQSVAEALRAAHEANLHGDVTPSRILFSDDGVAKLLHFRSAHEAGGVNAVTAQVVPYVAPEVISGGPVDFRADIYSLGATLFHLLTGRPPFVGDDPATVMMAKVNEPAPDVCGVRRDLRFRTGEVIGRMLRREPDERYASHDALIADLRSALDVANEAETAGEWADLHAALAGEADATAARAYTPTGADEAQAELESVSQAAASSSRIDSPGGRSGGPGTLGAPGGAGGSGGPGASGRVRTVKRRKNWAVPALTAAVVALLIGVIALAVMAIRGGDEGDDGDGAKDRVAAKDEGAGGANDGSRTDDGDSRGDGGATDGGGSSNGSNGANSNGNGDDTGNTTNGGNAGNDNGNDGGNTGGQNGNDTDNGNDNPPDVTPPDPPDPPDPPQPTPAELLAQRVEAWRQDAAARLARTTPTWRPLTFTAMRAASGAAIRQQRDGSVFVEKSDQVKDTYELTTTLDGVDPRRITAIRLEALPDERLPHGGPGWANNGNFALTRFTASISRDGGAAQPLLLNRAEALFSQKDHDVAGALKDGPATRWATQPRIGRANEAVFFTANDSDSVTTAANAPPSQLTITLDHQSEWRLHQLGKFRVSVTTDADPFLPPRLPENIEALVRKSADGLTAADRAALLDYFEKEQINGERYVPPLPTGTIAMAPPSPPDAQPGFVVRLVSAADGAVGNITDVRRLLAGQRAVKHEHLTAAPVINFTDGDAIGEFVNDAKFPASADHAFADQFALEAIAQVYIPAAGQWAFGCTADDFVELRIAGELIFDARSKAGVFIADRAGFYPLRLIFGERTGEANIELFAAPGSPGSPGEPRSPRGEFKLIGDAAGGGLHVFLPRHLPQPRLATAFIDFAALPKPPGEAPEKIEPYATVTAGSSPLYRGVADDALVLVPRYADWHYFAASPTPSPGWTQRGYPAVGWQRGPAGFGFGAGTLKTIVAGMKDNHTVFYMRVPFKIEDPQSVTNLALKARIDDAAIVYLNGHEVYRSKGLEGAGAEATVGETVRAAPYEEYPLDNAAKHLREGENVLAIEAHNVSAADSDFVIDPYLIAERARLLVDRRKVNAALGWQKRDAEFYGFDDLLVFKATKGRDSRMEFGNPKVPERWRQPVYVTALMRVDHAGHARLSWRQRTDGKDVNGEHKLELEPGKWVTYTFGIPLDGDLNLLRLDPVDERVDAQAEIKWIRLHATRDWNRRAFQEWRFDQGLRGNDD